MAAIQNSINDTYEFEHDKEYLFYWVDAQNNKIALDIPLKKENRVKVTAYPLHSGTHQRYKLIHHNNNYYHIQNKFSSKYLELKNTLIQNAFDGNNAFQQFAFIQLSTNLYKITTKGHEDNLCLDGSNHSFNICKSISDKKEQQFVIERFNCIQVNQVAPSTYIVWHSMLNNSLKKKNKISVMYSIQPLQSHYCSYWSCVFPNGYMGIQDKDAQLKWIIFSVWDVSLQDVIDVGPNTKCDLFDGEGIGVRTHIVYKWNIADVYTFKVVYENEINDEVAKVSSYFMKGNALSDCEFEHKEFDLIASIKVPHDDKYLFHGKNRFTNFTEDWDSSGGNGHITRKALFGNIKIMNNGVVMHCNEFHEWCPETRPFKPNNFCVQSAEKSDSNVCMTIGGF